MTTNRHPSGLLDDKVAIVTGAASGMGAATAHLFARAGAAVTVADRNRSGADSVAGEIVEAGGRAVAVEVDVTDAASVEAMVATTVRTFDRLDVAVNNAGITPDRTPLVDLDLEQWDEVLGVNLRGVMLCLKYELRQLVAQGRGGAIVNTGSTRSFRSNAEGPAYSVAKHGVIALTTSAALAYAADGIRVNAVCPGTTDTPLLRQSTSARGEDDAALIARGGGVIPRVAAPEEIAQANLWLVSDLSSYTTGHALAAEGGYFIR
jgi:NAD(P)-dependent dehydrogenase (short-subunit alcohol dehydrogenase family)